MRGHTHLLAGAALALATSKYTHIEANTIWFTSAAAFGALLPDIDHPKSTLGRIIKPISWALHSIFGHRTITHSLLFLFIVTSLLWTVFPNYPFVVMGICIGVISHLMLDALTVSGIPLLYPLKTKIRFPFYTRTGSFTELVLFVLLVITNFVLIRNVF
ncbi:metal-dependent hydrolase [Ectobacillus panaciterrae]|uniref:metal-dependent hydrolase n=1 Tax=Ectobacillus panaciterrae TaxID=363872 RepID=UPI00048EC276|nr:metal-dependent hydrolase [Ectobacillus panaciterrae]